MESFIKQTLCVIVFVVFLLMIGHLSISFQPFKIQLPYWHRPLGILLLILAFVVYSVGEYGRGYVEGLKKGSDMTIEMILKKIVKKETNDTD